MPYDACCTTGLAKHCVLVRGRPSFALFLGNQRANAYLSGMASWAPHCALVALVVTGAGVPASVGARAGVDGPVDAFVVREKIQKDLPKINRCYESALRYEPELAGKVSVRFAVMRAGHVEGVQILENTTGNGHVERCVTRVVSAIRFPRRRTGKSLRFTFPFVFAPQE